MWVVFILLVTVHVYTKYNFALYPLAFIFLYSKITIMSMKIFLLILIHFTDKMNFSASSLLHTPPHMQRASVHHNERAGEIIPLPGFGPIICKKGNQVCWFAVTALWNELTAALNRSIQSLSPLHILLFEETILRKLSIKSVIEVRIYNFVCLLVYITNISKFKIHISM